MVLLCRTAESHSLEDDYPETAANRTSISEVTKARTELLRQALSDGWAQGKFGWKQIEGEKFRLQDSRGLFDVSLRSAALRTDELEATLAEYGGRDHGKTVARLMNVGTRQSSGVDAILVEPGSMLRKIEDRIYTTPVSTLQNLPDPIRHRRRSNPLAHRVGGNLRRDKQRQSIFLA